MEIQDIKEQLTIANVLHYYGLKTDKQSRLNCPFHEDKTPSFQVYYKTQSAYCFSSSCKTHGKSMDVIDFILHKENCTKAEAINKAKEILNHKEPNKNERYQQDLSREQFLGNMYQYFKNAISNSKPAKDYLQSRSLDFKKIEVGYNGGQFHHGARKDETLINQCLEYGLLIDKNNLGRTGEKAYSVFGKWSICFALKNRENKVVSLYFRSTLNEKESKHFYLKNRRGLYPNYPNVNTKKLILTESIIDGASLLPTLEKAPFGGWGLIACFGTNGLNDEILKAIKELKQLEEIIFAFDNDTAGRTATANYSKVILELIPGIKISVLEPINKDINETLQLHDEEIFIELLSNRSPLTPEGGTKNAIQTPVAKTPPSGAGGLDFLKQKHLLKNLNIEIGKAGIVGEENSRMLLFLIIISYLNKSPLHALVQGSSGSGKTHIISRIADLMPQEDVLRFTRITESSLYNWGEFDLFQKVVIIEDLDGLKEDALYALREFISNQVLRSSVTIKDKKGNNKSSHKIVKGQFSSLSATTKGETYEDNMSRSFLIAVDESKEQTARIIDYQNKRNAGEIDPNESQKAIHFIQSIIRNLKVYEVINPYATKLQLPEKVHKIRRLNEMYQAVIKQVTFLNQYQRKLTNNNQLITEIEDIEQATEILFESIVLKVDELDGSLRQFFERLKKYVKNDSQEFILRDIRQELNISKTQIFRYIQNLTELEYVKQVGGYANKGIKYKICYWDNYQKLRAEIKDFLMLQIEQLRQVKK
ncbi:CHC2 zinc finger domain-containing protein [Flavobacterium covae]|uniref:CHC2 zinc finger domain-containing protein n=1 Tax=Flavobacterium covae TaxID=2906076 RepID=UPI001FB74940|nr:CHC2 zinc finger domain-containing protein [Flavobacterium covae]MCJ1805878.1 CHC2 zinc finger domain-containing protein [Flavobacterium covae]